MINDVLATRTQVLNVYPECAVTDAPGIAARNELQPEMTGR